MVLYRQIYPEKGGRIILRAMEEELILLIRLICITPTTHIRKALEYNKNQLIIASKSYDYERSGAEKSFLKFLIK